MKPTIKSKFNGKGNKNQRAKTNLIIQGRYYN